MPTADPTEARIKPQWVAKRCAWGANEVSRFSKAVPLLSAWRVVVSVHEWPLGICRQRIALNTNKFERNPRNRVPIPGWHLMKSHKQRRRRWLTMPVAPVSTTVRVS
ncbi:hypothetical protein HHJ78_10495 [Mobiluncus mulieris]|uniref:Uncharacterized protein n=1 Tax=Mobiluncus mulieris TaxID=2052 RepID=A0A7Y0U315_9ACTO|nr:hypothetical protein [Mobiluncus mulieris]NMW65922.1 hypothetical protein [Mobiluncus mulieris]